MRRLLLAAALSGLLLFAGCGGSSEDNEAGSSASLRTELLSRVSEAIQVGQKGGFGSLDEVVYVDLVGARKQLGFAADKNVYERLGGSATILLKSVAESALPYAFQPTGTPLKKAIDGGAIKAAASVNLIGPPSAVVIDTSQTFEEISATLQRSGYVRDGTLLVTDRSIYPVVADAGKGIVVAAGSKSAARAALSGLDAELTQAAELIEQVPGVARAASAKRHRCILARAAGQNLSRQRRSAPQRGEYLVVIDGTPDPAKLTVAGRSLPRVQGDLKFGAAEADRDRIRAGFRSEDPSNAAFRDMVDDDVLTSATKLGLPYAC